MNFLKVAQTIAAVTALVSLVKQANADKRITPAEWNLILVNGLLPLLAIHGVTVPAPTGNLPSRALAATFEVDRAINQVSLPEALH
jgi:hypothetical protein